jgi:hypothetical protein
LLNMAKEVKVSKYQIWWLGGIEHFLHSLLVQKVFHHPCDMRMCVIRVDDQFSIRLIQKNCAPSWYWTRNIRSGVACAGFESPGEISDQLKAARIPNHRRHQFFWLNHVRSVSAAFPSVLSQIISCSVDTQSRTHLQLWRNATIWLTESPTDIKAAAIVQPDLILWWFIFFLKCDWDAYSISRWTCWPSHFLSRSAQGDMFISKVNRKNVSRETLASAFRMSGNRPRD